SLHSCRWHQRCGTRTWISDQCDLQYGHNHDRERVVFGLLTSTRPSLVRWEEGGSKAAALDPLLRSPCAGAWCGASVDHAKTLRPDGRGLQRKSDDPALSHRG